MGDFRVREIKDNADRYKMYHYALQDIAAFERMWQENAFVEGPIKIGAEQELCVVNKNFAPTKSALKILEEVNDEHYTNELGLFNLEINLDPELLDHHCFSTIENKLLAFLQKGQAEADKLEEHIVMAGILPTINPEHLDFDFMTPIPRYKTLSQMLYNIRGGEFEIYLQGVDDLMASLGSVLFEACNTSFQLHLQLAPAEFVDQYNWSQMISGPVLAACTNSPLLFGRELWSESRIALFKQSLDTRNSKNHLRKKIPRVYFGNEWLRDSPVNLWKNELMRFPLILTSDDLVDSMELLANGETPELLAIRLHNGTTYTWNRLCYGPGKNAHLRIECRYLPAGPTAIDEIANFAFWVGLMKAMPEDWKEQMENTSFKTVKDNFIKASRNGLSTVFNWFGSNYSAKRLILDILLPMARRGLEKNNIALDDIDKYLNVIRERVGNEQTGANWTIQNFRHNSKKNKTSIARQQLVAQMIDYQRDNIPVHLWNPEPANSLVPIIQKNKMDYKVGQFMSTDIFSVNENTSVQLVKSMMAWKNIHHLPVENHQGDLVGIITDGLLRIAERNPSLKYAGDIMKNEVISVHKNTPISDFKKLINEHSIAGLPVTYKNKLVGMITINDLKNIS